MHSKCVELLNALEMCRIIECTRNALEMRRIIECTRNALEMRRIIECNRNALEMHSKCVELLNVIAPTIYYLLNFSFL